MKALISIGYLWPRPLPNRILTSPPLARDPQGADQQRARLMRAAL